MRSDQGVQRGQLPSLMRCLGQATGDVIAALWAPVGEPRSIEVRREQREARVDGALLRRTVIDEVLPVDESKRASTP
ncbi:MAG: hypothetical protein EXS00_08545 [Phycisphaerales bacterium]|nr:hypothetical protein [Phycisphaerales bacterium]